MRVSFRMREIKGSQEEISRMPIAKSPRNLVKRFVSVEIIPSRLRQKYNVQPNHEILNRILRNLNWLSQRVKMNMQLTEKQKHIISSGRHELGLKLSYTIVLTIIAFHFLGLI